MFWTIIHSHDQVVLLTRANFEQQNEMLHASIFVQKLSLVEYWIKRFRLTWYRLVTDFTNLQHYVFEMYFMFSPPLDQFKV